MGSNYKAVVVALSILIGLGCAPWKDEERKRAEAQKQEKRISKSDMKNPYARAKVGDWYIIRTPGTRQMKIVVIKANDLEVLIKPEHSDDPEEIGVYNLEDEEKSYIPPDQYPDVVSVEEKTMDVGGKMIHVKVVTRESGPNRLVTTWSAEVPIDGIVRSVRNDKVVQEVIDFLKN
ncbi:MAG: hypothetical protein O6952_03375 [Planctomycetota bacterium]|nr:hypothetical protein [Planctomycetota bacterium]